MIAPYRADCVFWERMDEAQNNRNYKEHKRISSQPSDTYSQIELICDKAAKYEYTASVFSDWSSDVYYTIDDLNQDGKLEFLWQKRAEGISRFPGYYDISAGGHVNLGETIIEAAIRETREEIGAEIEAKDLQFAFKKSFNKNRFAWIFMVDWTGKADDFHFDDQEVSEVKWVPYVEMEEFRKKFAKPPLVRDDNTFLNLKDWLEMHGKI